MESARSEVDWIICFAIIKHRYPALLTRKSDQKGRKITKLPIPDRLSNLKLNRSLVAHLDIVYQYTLNYEKLGENLEIMKSFSDDIKLSDIHRWFLPNYRYIMVIISLKGDLGDRESLRRLFVCFQLLLASFCCLQTETSKIGIKLIIDTLLMKFIPNDLLFCKQRNSKIVQQYVKKDGVFFDSSCTRRMCKLHCKTIVYIMNSHVMKIEQTISSDDSNYEIQFFLVVGKICFIIESMTHCLINQLSSKDTCRLAKTNLAYNKQYFDRQTSFDFQYTNSILFVLRELSNDLEIRIELLEGIIRELLRMFNNINWSPLDDYVKKNPIHSETMIKRRLYIQSSLLTAGNLSLISEFRLARWPSWSKID